MRKKTLLWCLVFYTALPVVALAREPGSQSILSETLWMPALFAAVLLLGGYGYFIWSRQRNTADASIKTSMDKLDESQELLKAVLLDGADGAMILDGEKLTLSIGTARAFVDAGLAKQTAPAKALAQKLTQGSDQALILEKALHDLLHDGQSLDMVVSQADGSHLWLRGNPMGSRILLRISQNLPENQAHHSIKTAQGLSSDTPLLGQSLDLSPLYAWRRNLDGKLIWVNARYAQAVEVSDSAEAVNRGLELVNATQVERIHALVKKARTSGLAQSMSATTVISGQRRVLEIQEVPVEDGSVGFALDQTQLAKAREAHDRQMRVNEQTLDRLHRGVAIFSRDLQLTYFNAAVAELWKLDAVWLDTQPSLNEVLNALRDAGRVPQMRDFASWRKDMLARYSALTSQHEMNWYLFDGAVLHVLAQPHPLGGILCLFEDVSDYYELKRDITRVSMVQNAALDSLREGVLVLGLDGRRRLSNQAFCNIWSLQPASIEGAHIAQIVTMCRPLFNDSDIWERVISYVSGESGIRSVWTETMQREDGSVYVMATSPLPDGATLFAFSDVTDSINKERTLREQNEKLEEISQLKSRFLGSIHNTSQELKIPLNTIIGFSEILGQQMYGELNLRQREYIDGIYVASNELRRLVSGIIDLAMLQADDFLLRIESVQLRRVLENTVRYIERNAGTKLDIKLQCPPDIGEIPGDPPRFREIVHNLINAIRSETAARNSIEVGAKREANHVSVWVGSCDARVPKMISETLAGDLPASAMPDMNSITLGVTLVRQFVERHGGEIRIEEKIGSTRNAVVCRFLSDRDAVLAAVSQDSQHKPKPDARESGV